MRFILITICSVSLCLSAYSQAPGYLGKRFAIGVSTGISPSFSEFFDVGELNFHASPELSLGYVISKNSSLGLKFNYFKSSISGNNYELDYEVNLRLKDYTTKTIGVGIDYKIYKDDFIAPIGSYWQFSFATFKTTSEDFLIGDAKSVFIDYYGNSTYNDLNTINISYYFGISWGKNFILYKSIGFDCSVYTGLTVNDYDLNAEGTYQGFFLIENDFLLNTTNVIKQRYVFGLKLKLDLLL